MSLKISVIASKEMQHNSIGKFPWRTSCKISIKGTFIPAVMFVLTFYSINKLSFRLAELHR
jgi:hypothetical protein